MLLHKIDKKFDGINPEAVREYHKYHISKTMGMSLSLVPVTVTR